jgi:hypothetical protein
VCMRGQGYSGANSDSNELCQVERARQHGIMWAALSNESVPNTPKKACLLARGSLIVRKRSRVRVEWRVGYNFSSSCAAELDPHGSRELGLLSDFVDDSYAPFY